MGYDLPLSCLAAVVATCQSEGSYALMHTLLFQFGSSWSSLSAGLNNPSIIVCMFTDLELWYSTCIWDITIETFLEQERNCYIGWQLNWQSLSSPVCVWSSYFWASIHSCGSPLRHINTHTEMKMQTHWTPYCKTNQSFPVHLPEESERLCV